MTVALGASLAVTGRSPIYGPFVTASDSPGTLRELGASQLCSARYSGGVLCMRGYCIPGFALLFCSGLGLADEPGSSIASPLGDEPAMEAMEVIVVTGEQPGP